jgi:membrane associated rhomboid family serine protease
MGIYDRDYYRREGPSFLGTFANRGQVCKWLVIANIIAFVIQMATGKENSPFQEIFILNPKRVFQGEVWRLLTYAFLHDTFNVWHIIINMLFLWWFGHELEEMYGHWEFLTFYLVAALLGGIAYTLTWAAGLGPAALCLGASGGVTAVMVLYAFHYPHQTILLFFLIPVPIWLLVVIQVAQDSFGFLLGLGNREQSSGGVAFVVHLAGAGFAALYRQFNWRLTDLWPNFRSWRRQRSRPRLRVYREDEAETPQPVGVPAAPAADVDEQLEAKLDEVLAKVARSGRASLTENELQILLRASEVYKKRRS